MAYPGGKNGSGVYQTIINLMPPHRVYVEGFLGGGAILQKKLPAIANIGIDSDTAVIQNWSGDELPGLQLVNADFLEWAAGNVLSDDTLIYLDPPYLMETRSCQRPIYRHEFTREQHERLLEMILECPCMVMISGYWSEQYYVAARAPTYTNGDIAG